MAPLESPFQIMQRNAEEATASTLALGQQWASRHGALTQTATGSSEEHELIFITSIMEPVPWVITGKDREVSMNAWGWGDERIKK